MRVLLSPQARQELERLRPSPEGVLEQRDRHALEPQGAVDLRREAGDPSCTREEPCANGRGPAAGVLSD
ncbi:hypothetical protein NDU88_002155 [Pleurodeles waltl]|uniref:Uncharacterized protein n=1 Tax=Pleurodeles waltl TaxID=8319 RepID=A0AAV7T151_PLEWA|nr:hypothetical protein NDU88_002155 [Pleurodeles waltl]